MARPPRDHTPDTIYHVMSRGVDGRDIFDGDDSRRGFLTRLLDATRRHGCSMFSYCLMGNHFHLLMAVSNTPLGIVMRDLLRPYSLSFNQNHSRVGHLFQSRYTAIACENESYLFHLLAYIHCNPVRSGFAATPSDWPWSSHGELTTLSGPFLDFKRIEKLTGLSPNAYREVYLDRLEAVTGESRRPRDLDELIRHTALSMGADPAQLLSGRRGEPYTRVKRALINLALGSGYTLAQLADALHCSKAALSLLMKRH